MTELQLKNKNIIFISVAFFSILMLWQIYNNYCPLFLDELLSNHIANENERLYIIGIIMACDNILALFLLPLFGMISDKTKSRFGKRKPYIVIGMILASLIFPFIAVFYMKNSLIGVIVVMGLVLMVMHMFRTPAISLMPDITPKPLRSKANGIINLIGYFGPIIAGVIIIFINYQETPILPFMIGSAALLLSCVFIMLMINENRILKEMKEDILLGEKLSQSIEEIKITEKLSKEDKRNMIVLLLAVFLWFMSFNAIESFLSLYAKNILNDERIAGVGIIILTFSGMITFVPSGMLANKIGRKKSVLIGLVVIIIGFTLIALVKNSIIFYMSISLSGIGWAMINVNSYPMVCEMAHQGNIGKYSGYYYTASMGAQSLTPIVIGFIMGFLVGLSILFVYAAVVMSLALITMLLFKENKNIVGKLKKGFAVFDDN